ncbi:MAG TPA: tetratricopeptide repeat protein [Verrucomicrobiae bacterium]
MSLLGSMFRVVHELNAFCLRDTREKALAGDVREQFLLGTAYFEGSGVEKNDWEAAHWFQRAADQGHGKAMTSLGIMYLLGRGVPKDAIEGVKWLIVAARRGHAPAKKALDTAKLKLVSGELEMAEQYAEDFIRSWDQEIAAQQEDAPKDSENPPTPPPA